LLNLMGGEDKEQTGRFFIAVQEAMRDPGRNQHGMARADRSPLAAKKRVQSPFQDDYGRFGMWIDASWNSSIGRDGHFFDVERLATLICAHQDTGLQPWSGPCLFVQTLFVDDWHLYSFRYLPAGAVEPGPLEQDRS
jgi:hypothetical protein